MKDNEKGAVRITVAEALRRVKELISQNPEARRFPDKKSLYSTTRLYDPLTEERPERPQVQARVSVVSGKDLAIQQAEQAFNAFCAAENVVPRNLHNPWGAPPYTGEPDQHFTYDIALSDYEKWAAPYMQSTIPWTNTAAVKPKPERTVLNLAASPTNARKLPSGGDALTPMIWAICYDLQTNKWPVTPRYVMNELQKRAASEDAQQKKPLLSATAGGVKYENFDGKKLESELNFDALKKRMRSWRIANQGARSGRQEGG